MLEFWLLAFMAPMTLAVGNLVDNHLLHRAIRDPVTYDVITIMPSLVFGALIPLFTRVSASLVAIAAGTAIGFSFALMWVLYDVGMMKEEGTSVVSIVYTIPLYVAVLSWLFLGEVLTAIGYAGIAMLLLSVLLVFYRRASHHALLLALAYAVFGAVTRVVSKPVLGQVDVWSYMLWVVVGQNLGALALSCWPAYRQRLRKSIASLRPATVLLVVVTASATFGGYFFLYSAISLGPVALASGITAVQPFVLLVYSTAVLLRWPGSLPVDEVKDRYSSLRKVLAAALIILGTLALTVL
jgi:drug/metabolite transporter (DMT)-like permease